MSSNDDVRSSAPACCVLSAVDAVLVVDAGLDDVGRCAGSRQWDGAYTRAYIGTSAYTRCVHLRCPAIIYRLLVVVIACPLPL
jgi:hypothetical protein